MKQSAVPPCDGRGLVRGQDSRVALLLPLVELLPGDLAVRIGGVLDARDSDGSLASAFASAIDAAIPVAARETELLLADLRRLAPSPGALSICGLSYVAGVLWNGYIDRRPPPICSTRPLLANEDLRGAVSTSDITARLEHDRTLLAAIAPLKWLLPSESQRLWDEQPDDGQLEPTPPYTAIRAEIERCLANLAGTTGPMADDLGLPRSLLLQLDHIAQIPHYRLAPARSKWGKDFFPAPIITSDERVDDDDGRELVQVAASRGWWQTSCRARRD
jgi:hypothetical protein